MRRIEKPLDKPHSCAIIPGRGDTNEPRGFIDIDRVLPGWDPHVYVSQAGAEALAQFIGWSSGDHVKELEATISSLEEEVELLKSEIAQADKFLDAVDVLESKGFRTRRRTGPRTKVKEEI